MKIYFIFRDIDSKGIPLKKGVIELCNGDSVINRLYVDTTGIVDYNGDKFDYDKEVEYAFTDPATVYSKRNITPIAKSKDKDFEVDFVSGDVAEDWIKDKSHREIFRGMIENFSDKIVKANDAAIEQFYADLSWKAKSELEKKLQKIESDKLKVKKIILGSNSKKFSKGHVYAYTKQFSKFTAEDFEKNIRNKVYKSALGISQDYQKLDETERKKLPVHYHLGETNDFTKDQLLKLNLEQYKAGRFDTARFNQNIDLINKLYN